LFVESAAVGSADELSLFRKKSRFYDPVNLFLTTWKEWPY